MNRERFQTIAIIFSFVVNLILVIVVIALATQYVAIKTQVNRLVSDLDESFGALGATTIDTTIPISQSLRVAFTQPVQFVLPLDQETTVTTLTATPINTTVRLSLGQFGQINAPVSLNLPAGTPLRVRLSMKIPVSTSINIDQQVPVLFNQRAQINLGKSGLDPVVLKLRGAVEPAKNLIQSLP